MTRSDNHGERADRRTGDLLHEFSHYDFILLVIPVAFLIGYLGSNVGNVPLEGGMAVAAVVGALAVLDALFVHAPGETGN